MKGLASEDRALELNPDYLDAMVYKNILLRMQANLTPDTAEQARLIEQADVLRNRVTERQKALGLQGPPASGTMPPPPPPAPPVPGGASMTAEYRQVLDMYKPLRIGGNLKTPIKIKDVKPLYPPEAQAARVQGVVILEAVIDPQGQIAATRVLRSIPMLDEAAVSAVQQWQFTPTLMNGEPAAVVMTLTVNFTLQ